MPLMRSLLALFVAASLVLAGCADGDDDATGGDTPTTTEPDPPSWVECSNDDEGFTVEHPPDWETNDGSVMSRCSLFDPEPIEVEPATEIPLDIAVTITVEPTEPDRILDAAGAEELSREESTVDGREAVRQETRATGDALAPEGTLTTRWVVTLDDGALVARTHDVGEPPYEESQAVLDQMVGDLTVHGPTDPGTTTTTAPTDEGPDLVGEPSTSRVQSEDFPGGFADTAYLVDVRTATHDGFERVVLEFEGDEVPSYRIGYVDPPIRQPGSGHELAVEGAAFLELRLEPATSVDLTGPEFEETYTGPERIALDGPGPTTELVFVGDFESNMAWVIGSEARAPFAVAFFEDPLRLVVDIVTS
jgi:hypothetical protein